MFNLPGRVYLVKYAIIKQIHMIELLSDADKGPLSTHAISRWSINITSSNRALKYTFLKMFFAKQPQRIEMNVNASLYTYLKSDLVASGCCFRMFFLRRMYHRSSLIAPKKGGRRSRGPQFPRILCEAKHATLLPRGEDASSDLSTYYLKLYY